MTVWTKNSPSNRTHYHTDEDCHSKEAIRELREVSEEQAEKMGLELCQFCSGELSPATGEHQNWKYYRIAKNHNASD